MQDRDYDYEILLLKIQKHAEEKGKSLLILNNAETAGLLRILKVESPSQAKKLLYIASKVDKIEQV